MENSDPNGLIDFSDITAISVTIVCLVLLIIVIHLMSTRMDADSSDRVVEFGPHQRSMVKVSNPYVLELDGNKNVLTDGAKLRISSLCSCHVAVIWGPNIQALHKLILEPGRLIRTKVLTSLKQSTDLDPLHFNILKFDSEGKHIVNLPCPDSVSSQMLGEMPRKRYPLGVFLFTQDDGGDFTSQETSHDSDDEGDVSDDNQIIGLFAIIHLKDRIVTKDSHIIGKYVKTHGVPIYALQALFSSSMDNQCGDSSPTSPQRQKDTKAADIDSQCSESFSRETLNANVFSESSCFTESEHNNLDNFDYLNGIDPKTPKVYADCVVCQSKPAKCAILPCRHNCICLQCLLNLDKCPICRSAIESYFVVGYDISEWSEESEREHAQVIRRGIAAHVENMFTGINNWVGFR